MASAWQAEAAQPFGDFTARPARYPPLQAVAAAKPKRRLKVPPPGDSKAWGYAMATHPPKQLKPFWERDNCRAVGLRFLRGNPVKYRFLLLLGAGLITLATPAFAAGIEGEVLAAHNALRAQHGVPPLRW